MCSWATGSFLGGLSGVHQFVRVGAHAMTGFQTRLSQDVPPFVTVAGNPAEAQGINAEGLKRRGFSAERIDARQADAPAAVPQEPALDEATQQIDALRRRACRGRRPTSR